MTACYLRLLRFNTIAQKKKKNKLFTLESQVFHELSMEMYLIYLRERRFFRIFNGWFMLVLFNNHWNNCRSYQAKIHLGKKLPFIGAASCFVYRYQQGRIPGAELLGLPLPPKKSSTPKMYITNFLCVFFQVFSYQPSRKKNPGYPLWCYLPPRSM